MKHGRVTSSDCSAASCSACGGWPVPASMMTLPSPRKCSGQSRPLVVGRRAVASRDQQHLVADHHRQAEEIGRSGGRRGQPVDDSGPGRLVHPERGRAVAAEIDQRRRLRPRRPQRQCTGNDRRTAAALCSPTENHVTPPPTNRGLSIGGSQGGTYRRPPRMPTRRRVRLAIRRASVVGGGVWAPGGLHRLQSGRDERSSSGGFDSRPPPPHNLVLPGILSLHWSQIRVRPNRYGVCRRISRWGIV